MRENENLEKKIEGLASEILHFTLASLRIARELRKLWRVKEENEDKSECNIE